MQYIMKIGRLLNCVYIFLPISCLCPRAMFKEHLAYDAIIIYSITAHDCIRSHHNIAWTITIYYMVLQ